MRAVIFILFALACCGAWAAVTGAQSANPSRSSTRSLNGQPLVTQEPGPSWASRIGTGVGNVARGTWDIVTLKPVRDKFAKPQPPSVGVEQRTTAPPKLEQPTYPAPKKPGFFKSLFQSPKPPGST